MIKRTVSLFTVLVVMLSVCFTVSAAELPFDSIEGAPERLHFVFSYPNEGSESIEAVFTVPDELCRLRSKTSDEQEKYYGSAYECCVQYDWSLDSNDGWHYNETWETAEGDYPFQRLTGSFVEKQEVFWFKYDEAAERCKGAVTGEQTEYEGENVTVRRFDFSSHELYVRARFFIYEYSTGKCYVGDWSDTYLVNEYFEGKSAGEYKGAEKGVAPDISSVRMNDDNTVTFEINFDDSTKEQAYLLKCSGNPDFTIESQVRIDDGEWSYWITGNELYPYLVGTNRLRFNDSHFDSKIEYRCRVILSGVSDLPDYNSGWSDIVTVENGEAVIIENDDPFSEKAQDPANETSDKCAVCGICPFHPFGVCMFIWIGIVLLAAAVIVYNVVSSGKKKKKMAEVLKREQESRNSDEKKEESIINIDLTPKIKKDTDSENGGE